MKRREYEQYLTCYRELGVVLQEGAYQDFANREKLADLLLFESTKTDPGKIDETVTYTLNATNGCGGTETKTAELHIVGSIERPEVKLSMRSVYFPTDRPRSVKREAALLDSEQETLKSIADTFQQYLANQPDAHLVLSGHADKRGPQAYNQPLSERRAQAVVDQLVKDGVAASALTAKGYGSSRPLVDNATPEGRAKNRRVEFRKQ